MENGFESGLRPGTIPGWSAGVVPATAIWEMSVKCRKALGADSRWFICDQQNL